MDALSMAQIPLLRLIETDAAAVFVYQAEHILYANDYALRTTGYTRDDLIGMGIFDLVHPDSHESFRTRLLARQQGDRLSARYALQIITKTGETRWLDFAECQFQLGTISSEVTIAFDVTEQKRAEEVLHLHANRFRLLHDIDYSILASQSPQEIAQEVLRRLPQLGFWQCGIVIEFNPDLTQAHVLAVEPGKGTVSVGAQITLSAGFVETLQQGIRLVDVAALSTPSPWDVSLQAIGIRSYLNAPLTIRGTLVGALTLGSDKPGGFDAEALDIAREVANSLSVAIQNARLLEGARQRAAALCRSSSFLMTLSRVAARIASADGVRNILDVLSAELGQLHIACLVALYNAQEHALVTYHASVAPSALEQISALTDLCLRPGYRLPQAALSLYRQLAADNRAVYSDKPMSLAETLLGGLSEAVAKEVGRLSGVTEETHALYLPLAMEGQVLGLLALWGPSLRQEDSPVALVFASQVAAVLERARLSDALEQHEKALARMSARVVQAQEEERKRISRELHDEIGQALTAISIDAAAIAAQLSQASEEARARLIEIQGLVDRTLDQVREISLELRPPMLDDLGIVPALRWYVNRWSDRLAIPVQFRVKTLDERLPPAVETALFRIVQEALTNVARHAKASQVTILLTKEDARVTVTVEDDGQGFEAGGIMEQTLHQEGTGLIGIQERVAALGGRFALETHPGKGTCLWVEIPLEGYFKIESS